MNGRGKGAARQPWLIGLKGGALFALAGLWERWTVPKESALKGPGEAIETCAILTTAANESGGAGPRP